MARPGGRSLLGKEPVGLEQRDREGTGCKRGGQGDGRSQSLGHLKSLHDDFGFNE